MFTNFIIPAYSVFREGWNQKTFTKVTAPKFTESTNSTMPAYEINFFRGTESTKVPEPEKFVEEAFSGSLPAFIAAFTKRKTLSEAEIAQIRRMIDEYREG